jgi:hypothetical protein
MATPASSQAAMNQPYDGAVAIAAAAACEDDRRS